ncbi:MAG: IS200/IS605 family transposase [Myxococcota bacterium]
MSQSLASVKLHIIFSTKERTPWLSPEIRHECHRYLATVAKNNNSHVYEVGGVSDHVHILLTLPRTLTLSKLVEILKTATSKWIKKRDQSLTHFAWQTGYGVFSVSQSQLPKVQRYIKEQELHHQKASFKDELVQFLKNSNVKFNEEYLLD